VLAGGETLGAESLPESLRAPPREPSPPVGEPLSLEEVERRHVEQVLASSATLEEAAARLGIDPSSLWRKRRRWGLG
jgi:NtrC-family two-component system response regulator AlgB